MQSLKDYFKKNKEDIHKKYEELIELKDEFSEELELNDLEFLFLISTIILSKIEDLELKVTSVNLDYKIPNSIANIDNLDDYELD